VALASSMTAKRFPNQLEENIDCGVLNSAVQILHRPMGALLTTSRISRRRDGSRSSYSVPLPCFARFGHQRRVHRNDGLSVRRTGGVRNTLPVLCRCRQRPLFPLSRLQRKYFISPLSRVGWIEILAG